MERSTRRAVALVVLVVGAVAGIFLGGGQVGPCLGPLGVTVVQCAQATGVFPDMAGVGVPIFVLAVAVAALLLAAPPRSRWPLAIAAAIVGGAVGSILLLTLAPRTLEGLTSSGAFISIARPLDLNALVAFGIAGALVTFLLVANVRRVRRRER